MKMTNMNASRHKIEWLEREWLKRPLNERESESHILLFYAEIQKSHPAMLNIEGVKGDVYQFLKTKLRMGV